MPLRELLGGAFFGSGWWFGLLAGPALVALLLSFGPARHRRPFPPPKPLAWLYAVLIYVTSVPGVFALTLTLYTLLFTSETLLDVNLSVYGLPILTMGLTLGFLNRVVDFDLLPGFERLSGLMVLMAVSFAIVFVLFRLRVFLFFGGSMGTFIALFAIAFALLKVGAKRLLG